MNDAALDDEVERGIIVAQRQEQEALWYHPWLYALIQSICQLVYDATEYIRLGVLPQPRLDPGIEGKYRAPDFGTLIFRGRPVGNPGERVIQWSTRLRALIEIKPWCSLNSDGQLTGPDVEDFVFCIDQSIQQAAYSFVGIDSPSRDIYLICAIGKYWICTHVQRVVDSPVRGARQPAHAHIMSYMQPQGAWSDTPYVLGTQRSKSKLRRLAETALAWERVAPFGR